MQSLGGPDGGGSASGYVVMLCCVALCVNDTVSSSSPLPSVFVANVY